MATEQQLIAIEDIRRAVAFARMVESSPIPAREMLASLPSADQRQVTTVLALILAGRMERDAERTGAPLAALWDATLDGFEQAFSRPATPGDGPPTP